MVVRKQVRHPAWAEMSDAFNSSCPARDVLHHLTSRWGVLILTALGGGALRFSELHAMIGGISEKMLSQTLRTLTRDGLVGRAVEPTTPPRVTYELTALGEGLTESLQPLLSWIRLNTVEVVAAQCRHDREHK